MKQTIRMKGLTLAGDEMAAEHGELALCGDVELYSGALRPSVLNGTMLGGGNPLRYSSGGSDVTLEFLYFHATASYKHYISRYGTGLYWSEENVSGQTVTWSSASITATGFDASKIISISSVGNTLCIMTDTGLHYFLCKYSNNAWSYNYLGQQPPFLEVQFQIVNPAGDTARNTEEFDFVVNEDEWWGLGTENYGIKPSVRASITEQVEAAINKRIDTCLGAGRFYAPFLIRYCYRLFDGSMIMHSMPVMIATMMNHPVITWIKNEDISKGLAVGADTFQFCVYMRECMLNFQCLDDTVIGELQNWSDIVKSVDFFVTPQFSRIDTAALIEKIRPSNVDYTDNSVCLFDNETITHNFNAIYQISDWGATARHMSFVVPEYPEGDYIDRIKNSGTFFKIRSIDVENLSNEISESMRAFTYDVSSLKNVTVQEQMKDDYKTHNLLRPTAGTDGKSQGGLYVYNHRLNVYGISEQLFDGFSPAIMFPWFSDNEVPISSVDVYVNTDSGTRKVTHLCNTPVKVKQWYLENGYCFYPDSRASYMVFHDTTSNPNADYARKLSNHPVLNGAFALYNGVSTFGESGLANAIVPLLNKIYTSRADNPFYFPNLPDESGINSVGIGTIIGIAAVTRPLVSGEVGRQNLVVFATDGIWVCEVSSTGTYSSMRNLSREVCADPDSICQLDQSIFFATNRSLSRFVESDVPSISKVLDGPYFDVKNKMTAMYNELDDNDDLKMLMDFRLSIERYLETGRVIYDYTSMRILVLPQNYNTTEAGVTKFVAMVYSIRDGAWSTMCLPKLKAAINSYPSPYIQYGSGSDAGKVVCLDKPYDFNPSSPAAAHKGLIVTRTLSFSDTMDVLRGFRQYTDAATMPTMYFYGSNDQNTWVFLGKTDREYYNYLPGNPYRFFRIGISLSMTTGEKYQQMELEVINKYAKL